MFLGFYIAANTNNRRNLSILAFIFCFSVIGESLLTIAQYIHQGSINGILYFLGERKFLPSTPGIANASINGELILRPYGTFTHPNVLAGYLLCSLIFIFKFYQSYNANSQKVLKSAALILGSVALLLTLSRVIIILWLFLLTFVSIQKILKFNKHKLLLGLSGFISLLTVILLFIIFFTPVLSRLESTTLSEESLTQREQLLASALTMIRSKPFFGIGLNNFLPVLSQIEKPASSVFYYQPVHNTLVLFIAETGLIGAIFLVLFFYKSLTRLKYNFTPRNKILFIILSCIVVSGLFDHYWLTLQQGQLLFALFLGLYWAE